MHLGQDIRNGVKWLIIGNSGQRVLEFAFGVVLARLLVPADFGIIITIQVFTGFMSMLTSGGMGQALIRAKTVDKHDFNAVFTLQLGLGLVIYLGFFLTAPWFAVFFENPVYKDLMVASALMFLMRPFAYMHASWLNREMNFKKQTEINILTGVVTGISSVLMAWYGMGVWSLTLSGLLGGLSKNILLARATPLRLRLHFNLQIMRHHGSFGSKIVANDMLVHVRREGFKLVLTKLAGPSFLGLFNKAESLHELPYQTLGQPVAQPLFRAMSKVQDDQDKTKYLYYRAITLLMVYTLPFYVGLYWIAQPFIEVVYGEKWMPSIEPLEILTLAGFFNLIGRPASVLLTAQNRLIWEMYAQVAILIVTITACLIGLEWGLAGAAWAFLTGQIFSAFCLYALVCRAIHTTIVDLFRAITPGLSLAVPLFLVLAIIDFVLGDFKSTNPVLYTFIMSGSGGLFFLPAFFLLPISALKTEQTRWQEAIIGKLRDTLNKSRSM